ncbi:Spo19p NDAI_0E02230 [Naumovozyma dairenensis CBS 421]|uniref:Uncharacterized protein n=1 Tax=Naumovozyma dairenensis (strain ATCC 10597 / BCRC 20456 / CBS 421 / NBRC 0211 / NRRL Y-12639) TaxID=1071378 RepID=G0WBC0_NAUDC|nr:hypothetical protein NDAI_0E02230 [Naumovozyma dairenensis CBS 421]CCD25040.1 hypothetical protein NDAI_0E02230 [Naumovozyma dairenensis CBS 421]
MWNQLSFSIINSILISSVLTERVNLYLTTDDLGGDSVTGLDHKPLTLHIDKESLTPELSTILSHSPNIIFADMPGQPEFINIREVEDAIEDNTVIQEENVDDIDADEADDNDDENEDEHDVRNENENFDEDFDMETNESGLENENENESDLENEKEKENSDEEEEYGDLQLFNVDPSLTKIKDKKFNETEINISEIFGSTTTFEINTATTVVSSPRSSETDFKNGGSKQTNTNATSSDASSSNNTSSNNNPGIVQEGESSNLKVGMTTAMVITLTTLLFVQCY